MEMEHLTPVLHLLGLKDLSGSGLEYADPKIQRG
jgi:hypothetical protein